MAGGEKVPHRRSSDLTVLEPAMPPRNAAAAAGPTTNPIIMYGSSSFFPSAMSYGGGGSGSGKRESIKSPIQRGLLPMEEAGSPRGVRTRFH